MTDLRLLGLGLLVVIAPVAWAANRADSTGASRAVRDSSAAATAAADTTTGAAAADSARRDSTAGRAAVRRGDARAGKKTFQQKCVPCHKADGSGGIRLTGNPTPDWRNAQRMADPRYDDDYLRDCITNGKPKSGMVAWSKQGVKPETIENLIAYIRTFSRKPAKKK